MQKKMRRIAGLTACLTACLMVVGAACVLRPSSADAFGWPSKALRTRKALESERTTMRREAAEKLTSLSPALARHVVQRALKDSDAKVRVLAARAAAVFGYRGMGDRVIPWLKETNPEVRAAALRVVALDVKEDHLSALARAVLDQNETVRLLAVRSLGRAPRYLASEMEASLAIALDDTAKAVRAEASEAIARLGLERLAVPVAGRLQDSEEEVRRRAAVALGVLGRKEVVQALVLALGDRSESVVVAAARSLGQLGSEEAIPALIALVQRPRWDEKSRTAARALAVLGTRRGRETLVDQAGRPGALEDIKAALLGSGAEMKELLDDCLTHSTGQQLLSCVSLSARFDVDLSSLVSRISRGEVPALPVLSVLPEVRDEELMIFALERLEFGDEQQKTQVLDVLQRSLPFSAAVGAPLTRALSAPGWSVSERARLLGLIAEVPGKEGLSEARRFLSSSQPALRAAAASVVAQKSSDHEEVIALLRSAGLESRATQRVLKWGMKRARATALIRALGKLGGVSVSPLTRALEGAPADLGSQAIRELVLLVEESRGATRDLLLSVLARQRDALEELRGLFDEGSQADRRAIVTLALLRDDAVPLHQRGAKDRDAWVRAISLQGLSSGQFDQLVLAAKQEDPAFVRTAAWMRLARIAPHRAAEQLDVCTQSRSSLLGVRLAALRLRGRAAISCPEQPLSYWVLNARQRLVRQAAARALSQRQKNSSALRACSAYEVQPSVARACAQKSLLPGEQDGSEVEPIMGLSPGAPYALLEQDGHFWIGVADRRGHVVLAEPLSSPKLLDPAVALGVERSKSFGSFPERV